MAGLDQEKGSLKPLSAFPVRNACQKKVEAMLSLKFLVVSR